MLDLSRLSEIKRLSDKNAVLRHVISWCLGNVLGIRYILLVFSDHIYNVMEKEIINPISR